VSLLNKSVNLLKQILLSVVYYLLLIYYIYHNVLSYNNIQRYRAKSLDRHHWGDCNLSSSLCRKGCCCPL